MEKSIFKQETKNRILDLAITQIISDYLSIKDKAQDERLYAFSLGIVYELTRFYTAANSIEYLKELDASQTDLHESLIWYTSEWKYSENGDNTVYKELSSISDEIKDFHLNKIMDEYIGLLIEALLKCKEVGLFDSSESDLPIVLFIQYADAHDENIENYSSAILNAPEVDLLFKNRWDASKENLTKNIFELLK